MAVYLTLQPIRRAAQHITMPPGGLLPHLFTLTTSVAVIFCHVAFTVADNFPLRNMVLYVARTFLKQVKNLVSDETSGCFVVQN